ncbi:MAG: hypothetical protein U0984_00045 [Prosthecobacter sp.]|nr:hypothetical protein [Prosthecobacter sp.]
MNRPVFTAFIFVIICAIVDFVGMAYFQGHPPLSSHEGFQPGEGVDSGANVQVDQIMKELGKVE